MKYTLIGGIAGLGVLLGTMCYNQETYNLATNTAQIDNAKDENSQPVSPSEYTLPADTKYQRDPSKFKLTNLNDNDKIPINSAWQYHLQFEGDAIGENGEIFIRVYHEKEDPPAYAQQHTNFNNCVFTTDLTLLGLVDGMRRSVNYREGLQEVLNRMDSAYNLDKILFPNVNSEEVAIDIIVANELDYNVHIETLVNSIEEYKYKFNKDNPIYSGPKEEDRIMLTLDALCLDQEKNEIYGTRKMFSVHSRYGRKN